MSVNDAERRKLGNWFTHLLGKSKRLPKVLREIMYGMTVHEMDLELRKERGSLDHLFMLMVFGDLVGIASSSPLLFDEAFTITSSPPSRHGRGVF